PRRDAPTCRGKADATRYGTVASASGACEAGTDRSIAPSASKCCWRAAVRRGKLVQHAWETGIALARGRRTPASERTGRHSHASPRSLSRPGRRGALLRLTRGADRSCRARGRDAARSAGVVCVCLCEHGAMLGTHGRLRTHPLVPRSRLSRERARCGWLRGGGHLPESAHHRDRRFLRERHVRGAARGHARLGERHLASSGMVRWEMRGSDAVVAATSGVAAAAPLSGLVSVMLETDVARQRLGALRRALLALHKTLVYSERRTFERVVGHVSSSGELLQLVIHDPWFVWLRPISALVVEIDERLDAEEPPTMADVHGLMNTARALLTPVEEGVGFGTHYYEALQRDPDVVLAHAEVSKVLATDTDK